MSTIQEEIMINENLQGPDMTITLTRYQLMLLEFAAESRGNEKEVEAMKTADCEEQADAWRVAEAWHDVAQQVRKQFLGNLST